MQVRKIIKWLGAEELSGKGSSVRFYHYLLEDHPFYNGYFQIHKIHKGGNKDFVRMNDYKQFMLPVLITILEIKENAK